jgi:hypothetical protein
VPSSVSEAVGLSFPPEQVAAVEAVLDGYAGNEPVRVKLAVLARARADLTALQRLVAAALVDYRDVLYWAEYPEVSKSMSTEEAAERYRAIGLPLPPGTRSRRTRR